MEMLRYTLFHMLIIQYISVCFGKSGDKQVTQLPGHLQRLGSQGPISEIDIVYDFPNTKDFFAKYVFPSKPLIIKDAVINSFPWTHWHDDYFLSLSIPDDFEVLVENKKKEDRKQPAEFMHFHKFVRQYNKTDQYMVESIPDFLGKDVVLPISLQCEEIYRDKIVDAIMWFSSGGTKSVLHTDSVENFNCLYHGKKEFIMIDPNKYNDQVDMDFPTGAYSGVDVDRVDFEKYPGLANVEYLLANISAGDCLYIPYRWIHQVRSYNRNIAVNVWWEGNHVKEVDISNCDNIKYDPTLTIDKLDFQGVDNEYNIHNIKEFFESLTLKGPMKLQIYYDLMLSDLPGMNEANSDNYIKILQKVTERLDKDKNSMISKDEVAKSTVEDWVFCKDTMLGMEKLIDQVDEISTHEYQINDLLPTDAEDEEDPVHEEL